MKGHTAAISCLQFEGNYLLSGSVDTKINIWDRSTQKVVRTLAGHTNTVRCLHLGIPKGVVISGSEDKTVRVLYFFLARLICSQVWDWDTGSVTKTLREHTGEITW
jgi:F-box/WD-40 domain protein MET30